MSYWSTFIGIVQKFCEEDPEIEELLKQTDQLQRENVLLENELDDHEREHTRLQIELFNVETMMEPHNQLPEERSVEETNVQLMESCANIRYAISQIDFLKILQCNHMQMEQNWRKEWQQMQDYSVAILKWHEKMEQRDVVQRYRNIEMTYKEAKNNLEKNQKSMEKSVQESLTRLGRANVKLNGLILCLVEGSRDMKNMREENQMLQEYGEKTERLRSKRSELMEQLEAAESKNFSSLLSYRNHSYDKSSSSAVLQTFNNDMPKFPTFAEILRSFNQDPTNPELRPEITVIQNTTNITVKSILRNSQDNSMEINQSITTKHTKQVRFKLQLEEQFEFTNYTDTTVSDTSSEDSQDTAIAVVQPNQTVRESENTPIQDEIPVVDLLTPSDDNEIEQKVNMDMGDKATNAREIQSSTKPKVEILECVVIKPPLHNVTDFPPQGKENIPPHMGNKKIEENSINTKKTDDEIMPPPTSPAVLKRRGDSFSKAFYEEFLKSSSSPNTSCGSEPGTPTATYVLKDFDPYLNESKTDSSKEQMEFQNSDNSSSCLDFMDFDSNNFAFDSNDENEEGVIMDFPLC